MPEPLPFWHAAASVCRQRPDYRLQTSKQFLTFSAGPKLASSLQFLRLPYQMAVRPFMSLLTTTARHRCRAGELVVVEDLICLRQILMGIRTYRDLNSASGSSGRIWPADCESLNSSLTS